MLILDDTEIRELHAAALSANLLARRGALMAGIDGGFVASLDLGASPGEQVMMDLDALNKTGALADGTVPLRTWLANAAHLARERVEGALFARYRDGLPAAGPPRAAPAAGEPRPEAPTPDRLLDALVELLPAQFDILVAKLKIPPAYLSGGAAPQAQRSIEILRWAQQREGRLADVARLLVEVGGPPLIAVPVPPARGDQK
jgi:hypothetical protein